MGRQSGLGVGVGVGVGAAQRERASQDRRALVGRIDVGGDGDLEELLDRVGRDPGRDGESGRGRVRATGRVDGIPVVDGDLLHLVPDDESRVLVIWRPRPHRPGQVGLLEHLAHPACPRLEGRDELVVRHPVRP